MKRDGLDAAATRRETRWEVLRLGVPVSLEAAFQAGLGLVDQVAVARLGEEAVAGVGLTNQLVFVITLVLGSLGTSVAILVAQHHGRGDRAAAAQAIGAAVWLGLFLSVPLVAVLALFPEQALQVMGAAPAVMEASAPFMRLIAGAIPLHLLAAVAAGALRSLGDTRTPMLITLGSVGINTGLNFLLVFGVGPVPALGVSGAALATLVSCTFRVLALAAVVASPRRQLALRAAHLARPVRPVLLELGRLSWPMALVELLWTASLLLYALMCARLGTREVVAWQISNTIEGSFIMLSSGLAVAGLTLVGQELGAGSTSGARAKSREVLGLGLQASILFGLLAVSGMFWLQQLYPEVTADAMRLAVLGLVLNALFQPAKVLNMILGNGVLRAGGDTRFILMADLLSIYAVGIPLALLLAFPLQLGFVGVLIGRLLEEGARLALYMFRYRTPERLERLALPRC